MIAAADQAVAARTLYAIENLVVRKGRGEQAFQLEVPRLEIKAGARVALAGPSGCGKSSLVDVLALLAQPFAVDGFGFSPVAGGTIELSRQLGGRDSSFLAGLRCHHIGFVPQVGGLIPALSVRQNIDLPCRLAGIRLGDWIERIMTELGLARHAGKKPGELSVGERQRCAIARALAHRPAVVIADEPTAALDPYNADQVMGIFCEMVSRLGSTLLLVSHDVERVERFGLARIAHRFRREQGRLVSVFGEA